MRRILISAVFLGLAGAGALQAQVPDPGQWLLDSMQGVWTLQAQERNGSLTQGPNPNQQFVINGMRFFTRTNGQPGAIGTIRIVDPLARPPRVDFIDDSGTVLVSVVDLRGDTMRYCGNDNGLRPADFVTRPGDGRSLSVWCRVAKR